MAELRPETVASAARVEEWSADELIPFGKYMLLDRISGGGTSAVYRANVRGEAGFERLVAIKRILPHMAGDPEFVKTFVREAKTVARLTHANICPIYELGKVGESLYMAIEYVAGKDLGKIARQLARRGMVMPPHIAAFIAARLCDALDYAHSLRTSGGDNAGVVHRDLSPTNILVSYEGGVKLIDFGLAKAVGRAQQTNVDALKKKLGYMSPEMVKGKPLDSRSDIFGVGVCLYEMLTGRRLFVGKDDIDTLKLVSTAAVPPPSAVSDDVPDDLEVVVMRALEKDPDDRFQTAGEMGQILSAWLHRTHGSFTTQSLSEWIHALFGQDVQDEHARIKRLLEASADNALMAARRAYFASPTGAAARARAEVERRLSTEPPAMRTVLNVTAPKAPKLPREVLPPLAPGAGGQGPQDEGPTQFYDRATEGSAQSAQAEQAAQTGGGFDEEPTNFVAGPAVDSLPPVRLIGFSDPPRAADDPLRSDPPRPTGGFEDEKTEFLQELELQAMIVPALDTGGFDEEPTHIFFNKEEGIGVPSLLAEINDVQEAAAPLNLNKPIVAEDLGLSPSTISSVPPAAGISIQQLASQPPGAPIAGQLPRRPASHTLPGVPMSVPPAAGAAAPVPSRSFPPITAPAPQAGPVPTQSAPAPGLSGAPGARRSVQPASRASSWMLLAVSALLIGVIVALVMLTPLGVALGLRTAPVGSIEVRTKPVVRASVLLDEVHRGSAPLRLDRVPAGLHRIEVQGDGYLPAVREVQVSTGKTVFLQLELLPDSRP